jgi:thiol:disulfide interchange protein
VAALWLLYRLAGLTAFGVGVAAMVALLLLLFRAGQRQRSGHGALSALPAALAFAVLAVVAVPPPSHVVARTSGAEPWSEARVASYVRQGRPVFVYFTADWCLSCKVNETTSIDRDEVRDAFKKAGVKVVAGDWTNGDPAITRFLESQGRAGVPLYLWYTPGKAVPEQLPQVLTPAMLISRAKSSPPCKGGARGGC